MLDRPVSPRVAAFRPHALHDSMRHWPETNCYTDLWIEVLASRGFDPVAALGFTLRQDFEGDQFTFFKVPLEDLETLFGVTVQELAVFDAVERHVVAQLARGRLPLVEVDGFFLPDTAGVSYRLTHPKTTVAIALIEPESRRMEYFHNAGYFELSGEDYDGIFRKLPGQQGQADYLFPYTEFAKFDPARTSRNMPAEAFGLARRHFRFRPKANPVAAFRAAFPAMAADLASRDPEYFHTFAFNTVRQLGANFELLAAHLTWMRQAQGVELTTQIAECEAIASGAKAFQFQIARGLARGKLAGLESQLDPVAAAYDRLFLSLEPILGA